jgi:hypothetical protein
MQILIYLLAGEVDNLCPNKFSNWHKLVSKKDVVILKAITPSLVKDLDGLIPNACRRATKAALKRSGVADAIAKVRERD